MAGQIYENELTQYFRQYGRANLEVVETSINQRVGIAGDNLTRGAVQQIRAILHARYTGQYVQIPEAEVESSESDGDESDSDDSIDSCSTSTASIDSGMEVGHNNSLVSVYIGNVNIGGISVFGGHIMVNMSNSDHDQDSDDDDRSNDDGESNNDDDDPTDYQECDQPLPNPDVKQELSDSY